MIKLDILQDCCGFRPGETVEVADDLGQIMIGRGKVRLWVEGIANDAPLHPPLPEPVQSAPEPVVKPKAKRTTAKRPKRKK